MRWLLVFGLFGCNERPEPYVFPDVDSAPEWLGPGGPNTVFAADDLFEPCAFLDAGPLDRNDVHNGVYPFRGYAYMPWARDIGDGGVSVFDVSSPCAPVLVGTTAELSMRETHTTAFLHLEGQFGGDWMVNTDVLGVQFWRVEDPSSPELVSRLELPGVTFIIGSYPRTVHSVSWQYPYLYIAAADNGVFVVDAQDPNNPVMVNQFTFDPPLRAGFVYAMGSTLFVEGSEERQAALMDISVPTEPQPIPGGRFDLMDADGVVHEAYSASVAGPHALFALTTEGSGVLVYDISDPQNPTYVSELRTEGNGGYVFRDDDTLFIGESDVARIIDASDMTQMSVIAELTMPGDLDTLMPYGNVALLSADEEAPDGEATAVIPWKTEVDATGPQVLFVDPADGATGQEPTLRLGIGLSEFVEPSSAFAGSVRLYDAEDNAIAGVASAQEGWVHYTPTQSLLPGEYRAELVAGGITDPNGNPIAEDFSWTFTVRE